MPWHVESDNPDCNGYAVVKDATGEIVGCHATRRHANAQLAALHIAEPNMRDLDPTEPWTPKQAALYAAYEQIVETTGMFDPGVDGNGAHYGPQSPFAAEGLVCANCVFYEGGQKCELVAGDINPAGICKLWIINAKLTHGRAGSGPKAIITDIDGTLEINGNVNQSLVDYLNNADADIIVITGRNESQRETTRAFLTRIGLKFNALEMSGGGNPNTFKTDTATRLLQRYTIDEAYENNPDARAGYESLGINAKSPTARRDLAEQMLASFNRVR